MLICPLRSQERRKRAERRGGAVAFWELRSGSGAGADAFCKIEERERSGSGCFLLNQRAGAERERMLFCRSGSGIFAAPVRVPYLFIQGAAKKSGAEGGADGFLELW